MANDTSPDESLLADRIQDGAAPQPLNVDILELFSELQRSSSQVNAVSDHLAHLVIYDMVTSVESKRQDANGNLAERAKDAAAAIRTGDMHMLSRCLQQVFEATRKSPNHYTHFRAQLKEDLERNGYDVRFKQDNDSISIHRGSSPYAVQFLPITDKDGKTSIRMQVYDWNSKQDLRKPSAQEVIKDFKTADAKSQAVQEYSDREKAVTDSISQRVKDAADALRAGDMGTVQRCLQQAYDAMRKTPEEYTKFRAQLKENLERDGLSVRFREDTKNLSVHRKFSPYGVEFSPVTDENDRTTFKAQAYDWNTKENVSSISAQEVVKDFQRRENDASARLASDRAVRDERTGLDKRTAKFFSKDQLGDFKENVDRFLSHAAAYELPAQEVAKTLKACRDLLNAPNTHFSDAERAKLAFQVMRQASDPLSIDQGKNDTCNATTIEKILYTRQPSKLVELMRDIAQYGHFKTANGETVKFNPIQLRPDAEASRLYTRDDERSYATQIANLALINAFWQTDKHTLGGAEFPKGSIRYEKTPDGERLLDYRQSPPAELEIDGKVIDSPKISASGMTIIMGKIAGKLPDGMILARLDGVDRELGGISILKDQNQLQKRLIDLASGKKGGFPVIVALHDTAQLDGKSDGEKGGHVVTVTGIRLDSNGKVLVMIDNQHGRKSDKLVQISSLWKAMKAF